MLFVGFFSGFIILILFHCLIFVRKSHGTFFFSRLYVHTIPNLVVLLFISQLKWIDINFFFFSLFSFVFFALAIYRFFPIFMMPIKLISIKFVGKSERIKKNSKQTETQTENDKLMNVIQRDRHIEYKSNAFISQLIAFQSVSLFTTDLTLRCKKSESKSKQIFKKKKPHTQLAHLNCVFFSLHWPKTREFSGESAHDKIAFTVVDSTCLVYVVGSYFLRLLLLLSSSRF